MRHPCDQIEAIIQEDIGNRGLRKDPASNLITATAGDFRQACESIAEHPKPAIAVVTGFFIPTAQPPAGETDGPLGALFLARSLTPLGLRVVLVTDAFCTRALEVGLAAAGLTGAVPLITLPSHRVAGEVGSGRYWQSFLQRAGPLTHLIALERVGPSHTLESLQAQRKSQRTLGDVYLKFLAQAPLEHQDRCHTMRGRDITTNMSPAHWLFESASRHNPRIATIGIGDGGNEIGMGKIPWDLIERNIPNGGLVACRVPTDQLTVCGISNWGAYGLAAGVRLLRRAAGAGDLFDVERERQLLTIMVQQGPLVDGVTAAPEATVDGISFARYTEPLRRLEQLR
jgi:hypothetical protein